MYARRYELPPRALAGLPWRPRLLAQELRRKALCFRNALDFESNGIDRLLEASKPSVGERSRRFIQQPRFIAAPRDPGTNDGVYGKCEGSKGPEEGHRNDYRGRIFSHMHPLKGSFEPLRLGGKVRFATPSSKCL
jgi:hypothetical protein